MLDLSYSRKLIRIPDLCLSPSIEEIFLSDCASLVQVHSSDFLSKLNCLCLNGCVELRSLTIPSNILSRSPGLILLYNCHMLETFSIGNRTEMVRLNGCSRRNIPPLHEEKRSGRYKYKEGEAAGTSSSQHSRPSFEIWQGEICKFNVDMFEEKNKVCSDLEKKEEEKVRPDLEKEKEKEGKGKKLSPDLEMKKTDPDNGAKFCYPWFEKEPAHRIDLYPKVLREGVSSIFPNPNELCWLDLSNCESLTRLPFEFDLSKLKFLKKLLLGGCSNLEVFPEIEDTLENLAVLILDQTAIQALPSSLSRLAGLEELSLHRCTSLEVIPSSIGSLSKLCKLELTCCESLETFPSSIFKLKLTKLDLHDCSMLRTFPEILEPAESFALVDLTKTAIKELPSSFGNLVGLRTLRLNKCSDLESLPNSIVNLNLLSELNCSGCAKLTEITESIAHLSSLKSLDLSDCKNLECIPQLPPFLNQLLAFDCPSIRRVMPNSRIQIPSNSKFKFHFTNSQQLDPSARANIVDDAWLRITEDAYRSVFFCFPGNAVPHWFPCRGEGHSVTMNKDSLNLCSDDRLIGFALCVVFRLLDTDDTEARMCGYSRYQLKFEFDDGTHILYDDELRNHFYWKKGQERIVDQDHIFLWKYKLESTSMSLMLCHARSFTFEISQHNYGFWGKSIGTVKECGMCPLYAKEKDNNVGSGDIEEPSGSKVA